MSITIIKLIAAFSMLLDHIAAVFGIEGWWFFGGEILRNTGKIAFPLFVFAIVNGWYHTKDKQRYFYKLVLFSILSQIPYSLAFSPINLRTLDSGEKFFKISLNYKIPILLFFGIILLCNYYFMKKNKISLEKHHKILFLLFLWNSVFIRINGIEILYDQINVLNTFICGLLIIQHYEFMKKNKIDKKYICSVLNSAVFILLSFFKADYGTYGAGIFLILLSYFTYHKKMLNCIIIIIWSFIFYGILYSNLQNALFTIISVPFILLYNEKKLPRFKNFFYLFYPFHLLLLGITNIIIKLY